MAKANSSSIGTPEMSSKSSKKSSAQPPKSAGRQTTLLGFFSKSTTTTPSQTNTPSQRRVERASLPLTPLPSSEVGDDVSPVRLPVRQETELQTGGLRTPVSLVTFDKIGSEMDIDTDVIESAGSRKVDNF